MVVSTMLMCVAFIMFGMVVSHTSLSGLALWDGSHFGHVTLVKWLLGKFPGSIGWKDWNGEAALSHPQ